jgi:hypothetical protein
MPTRVHAGLRRLLGPVLACGWWLGAASGVASAQADQTLYESQRVERALKEEGLSIDPHPEGKRIAFIEIVREDVLAQDEIWPTWPNAFHWLTRERIIRRELLVADGDRFQTLRVEESMRNLRTLGIFSLVRIVAVRTSDPQRVGVFVYTRDLWSLRLETAFSGAGNAFAFSSQLIERNVLGRNKQLAASFTLNPKAYSLGDEYYDARVLGGELALDQSFAVILNRDSGRTEGSRGLLSFGRPFRNLSQSWAWTASGSYAVYVARALQGSEVVSLRPGPQGVTPCDKPDPACLRSVWDDRTASASLSGSYRRGERYKQTFTLGADFSDHEVAANRETALKPGQEADFAREILPKARRQVYPLATYDLWLPNYVVYRDLSTFGHSESVRVGPTLWSGVSLPLRAFGSSTDSVAFWGGVAYVLGDGNALAEGSVGTNARLEEGRVVDQILTIQARGATPHVVIGRFVGLVNWTGRRHDSSQTQATLGGDNGLRGYEAGRWRAIGGSTLRANFEYRTLPLVLESVHVGGVLFYDAGSAYNALATAQFHHALGVGLRLLLPQFNLSPFRADLGFPLDQKGFALLVSYGTEQAVPLTAADDAAAAAAALR